jgi:PAS domain S-box-containing protein
MAERSPHRILFVDDDVVNRRALSWAFRDAGFQVQEAATGREALDLVQGRPDLVVLDVSLPDVNGFEVCRRIKEDPATQSVTVLHLSGVFVGSGDRSQGLESGADGYLTKPIEPRELLATVRALLRVREAEEAALAAAQQWRTTFDAIGDAVCVLDAAGTVLRCNRAMSALLGLPFAGLVGRPYVQVVQEGLGLAEPPPLTLPRTARERETREVLLGARWFEVTAHPVVGAQGAVTGSVQVLADITQRKELEEQLRQGQKMEAVGRLAGGVAHDFNNLLTAILGNAALLLDRLPPQETEHELAATIERAAWRAAELTRQLLGFSRQTLLWLQPLNLNDPITEVVGILRRTIDPRIALDVRCAPDLWLVQADPGQMSQVLMNLCLNARDAMPEGGRLTLATRNQAVEDGYARDHLEARPGPFVCLSVTDTGHGIPPDLLPRIFEPFFTTKEPGKGTGLGLAMVFGIVKQHRGWVECHSEPGRGTRFDIYLPRLEQVPAAHSPTPAPALASPAPSPGGTETVLLADDNAMLRNLAATLLGRNGFQVLLAEDGQEAVELYRKERDHIDLVVLDLIMPRLSGQDALRELRQINPDLRAVFVSGYADTQVDESEKAGVLGFINKPYRERDLIQAVRTALDAPPPPPPGERPRESRPL